jgi:hypothetical protein
MDQYKTLLEQQHEMAKIYNERKAEYKYNKQREEKRRYKESLKAQREEKKNK